MDGLCEDEASCGTPGNSAQVSGDVIHPLLLMFNLCLIMIFFCSCLKSTRNNLPVRCRRFGSGGSYFHFFRADWALVGEVAIQAASKMMKSTASYQEDTFACFTRNAFFRFFIALPLLPYRQTL